MKFKVGDWVVVLKSDNFYHNCDKGFAQKIHSINCVTDLLPYELEFFDGITNSYAKVRAATPEEIKIAQSRIRKLKRETVYIDDWLAEKVDGGFEFGCQFFTIETINTCLNLLQRDKCEFEISINGEKLSVPILKKLRRIYGK